MVTSSPHSNATRAAGDARAITRRGFVGGSARLLGLSAAALAGVGGGLAGCSSEEEEEIQVLEVAESEVVTLDSFKEYTSVYRHYALDELATLNAGTLLHGSSDDVCAAICQGEDANPLNELALLGLTTGSLSKVRSQAVGHDEGFEFLSASASSDMLVWVESNYLTSEWRVYCASVKESSLSIGDVVQLDEGDVEYDAPEVAAVDSTVYWVVQPAEDGSKTSEDSYLKASAAGASPVVIHTSHGRFCGGLSVSDGVLTAMPRVDTSGVYYQLTAFQGGTGAVIAEQVMPKSFKPSTAIYMNGRFAFTITASYDYGGGIANVGTYYPLDDGTYLRLTREPLVAPGLCGGWLFSKSGSRTVLVDVENQGYITVDAPDGTADYGDYPVFVGEHDYIYVYASVTDDDDDTSVVVRRISPK